ncbi:MAG: TIGR03857 family LLM class F420-dependent oxidoreductase [Pseudomonadota bacterium]
MTSPIYPEFGYYALPGHISEPKQIAEEIVTGERLGLGSVWISERLNTKNVEVLSGVAAALTPRMGIASGLLANMPLRNPLVTASYASTMMMLTDNRFALGVGRGFSMVSDAAGVAPSTFRVMEDYITILRQLWRGESVNYDGPLGTFRNLALGTKLDVMPPVIMAAMGDKTCEWAGRLCDGVVYNSLWSPAAVRHSTQVVRRGAALAGRDPKSVKVWSILVTASDVSEEVVLNSIIRRMNTYILVPPMFDAICELNGWDLGMAQRIRDELKSLDGAAKPGHFGDEHTTRDLDQLRHMRGLYPQHWLDDGVALGTASECISKVLERFDADVDGILFHGTQPGNLESLLNLWPERRPRGKFDGRSVNPGL